MSSDYRDGDGTDDIETLRRSRHGRLPADWDEWPRERKADWLQHRYNRIALLELLCAAHGINPEYQSDGSKEILTTKELAELYIETEGVK